MLPTVTELHKYGTETAASASLDLVVAHSDYIIQTEEMKNLVVLDFFSHFEVNIKQKEMKKGLIINFVGKKMKE